MRAEVRSGTPIVTEGKETQASVNNRDMCSSRDHRGGEQRRGGEQSRTEPQDIIHNTRKLNEEAAVDSAMKGRPGM